MENLKPVDVAIIGGGWTGLMMAKEITSRTGLTVAVLERGIPRKTADYATDMGQLHSHVRTGMMEKHGGGEIHARALKGRPAGPGAPVWFFLAGARRGGAG